MVTLSLIKLSVVYFVFDYVKADEERFVLACLFLQKARRKIAQQLTAKMQGMILLNSLFTIVMKRPLGLVLSSSHFLSESDKEFYRTLLSSAKPSRSESSKPRKLSSIEIAEYRKKSRRGENFDESIVWELPASGVGFLGYNRNDVPKDGLDQIGTKETINSILRIASEWNNLHPAQSLQIGDLSRPGGLDTSQHATHQDGRTFDMRPLRKRNGFGPIRYTSSDYSIDLTKEFILLVRKLYPNTSFIFDDPKIYSDPAFSSFVRKGPLMKNKKGQYIESHADHLHVIFPGG